MSKQIKYGKVDLLDPDELNPKYCKVLISFVIPGDILEGLKAESKDYKKLINKVLKDYVQSRTRSKNKA